MLRQIRQLTFAALVAAGCTKETPARAAAPKPFVVTLTAKQPGVASAVVVAKEGYHVNPDYPVAFKPAPESTVTFASERLALGTGTRTPCAAPHEADACQAAFDVPFTAAPGAQTVQGTLAFSVCSADTCLIEKMPLTLALAP